MLGWTYNCVYCWLRRAVFFARNKWLNIYIEFGFVHHHLSHVSASAHPSNRSSSLGSHTIPFPQCARMPGFMLDSKL